MSFIGKGTICGLTGWIAYLIEQKWFPNVTQPAVPAILCCITAFAIAFLMLSLFDFAAIAILQCFLTNLEAGGTVNTPNSLKPFIEAINN